MASSGSSYKAFARHRLVLEWSTQGRNIANNLTVLNGRLYLQSMDAYGAIYASAVGEAQVTINGQKQTEKANSWLSAYQKKILLAKDYPVRHNNDGTKTVSISGSYYVNVTFAGTYYGTVSVGAFNATLNTIPRASSLNAIPTFTLPNNPTFSINRQSSSFTHNVTFWVEKRTSPTLGDDSHYTYINGVENVGTSGSISLTPAMISTILNTAFPNGKSNASSGKMKLWTRQLSESSPSQQRSMMINLPTRASATGGTYQLKAGTVMSGTLKNFNSNTNFSYDLTWGFGNFSKTLASKIKSNTWRYTLTQEDVDTMLKIISSAKDGWGQVYVTSYYNGTQFGARMGGDKTTMQVIESEAKPTLNGSATFLDSNSATAAITGDNQVTIQGLSKLSVTTPSNYATARGQADLKTITVSHGGVSTSATYVAGGQTLTLTPPTSLSANTLVVTVTDSRGYSVSQTLSVPIYAYSVPKVNFTVLRKNNFLTSSDLTLATTWSPISIGGINKNGILKATYEIRESGSDLWGSPENIPYTISGSLVKNNPVTIELPNEQKWDVRVTIQDKINTSTTTVSVPAGKPIMFIDVERKSVSFGDLTGQTSYAGVGAIELQSEQYHQNGRTGIQMNNSDISGVNGIWFADPADNAGEGIHFLKTGKELSSLNRDDYDHFYMRDGGVYINSDTAPIFNVSASSNMVFNPKMLWQGVYYMAGNQTVTPSKPLNQCRNGWVLLWSQYDSATGTAGDADLSETYISKTMYTTFNGGLYRSTNVGKDGKLVSKLLYIYNDKIVGHERNATSQENGNVAVLRRIHEW